MPNYNKLLHLAYVNIGPGEMTTRANASFKTKPRQTLYFRL